MNIKSCAVLISVLISVVLIAYSEMEYPNWLLGKSLDYPEKDYVIAVGEAEDMYAAKQSAFAELSKIFETRIQQIDSELLRDRAIILKKENKKEVIKKKNNDEDSAAQETIRLVQALLDSARIADTWYNGKINRYYALAVTSKTVYDDEMVRDIQLLDEAIKTYINSANNTYVYLEKVKYCSMVLRLMKTKADIVNRKRLIDPLAIGFLSVGPLKTQLEKKREEFISKVSFNVFDISENQIGIKEEIEKVTKKAGYKVNTDDTGDAAGTVLLRFKLNINMPKENKDKIKFVHWLVKIDLVEGGTNRILSQTSAEGQASDVTIEKAKERALVTSKKATAVAAKFFVKNYINGYK